MSQNTTAQPIYIRAAATPWTILNRIIVFVASHFGSKSKEVERFLKFAVVGVIGALVDFGTVLILQATVLVPADPYKHFKVITATTIAFVLAVTSNFIWNRYWTYPDSRSRSIRRQLAQFGFINAIGWGMRTLWITLTFKSIGYWITPYFVTVMTYFSPDYVQTPETVAKVGSITAQLFAIGIVMIWNFFANRYWTYNDVD